MEDTYKHDFHQDFCTCTKSNISFILVISIFMCFVVQSSAFRFAPITAVVSTYRKSPPAHSLRAVSSTEKPVRSYQVDTLDPGSPSFVNLSNLKQAKGISSNTQLPELEKLSESELLKNPSMEEGTR